MDGKLLRLYLMGQSALDRQAYCCFLQEELRCAVKVESDFTPPAVWAALRTKPDFVLVEADVFSPMVRDAVQMVRRLRPEARIMVISMAVHPSQVHPWSACHLDGYVVKDGGLEELKAAFEAVLKGKEYFSEGVREALQNGRGRTSSRLELSPREAELLPLLASGMSLRDAALQMTVSYKTADSYRTNLLRKLGMRSRVELTRYAIREKIVDP